MSHVKYLFDEHMPDSLINAVVRREPSIFILRVGQAGAPAKGTLDPQVIEYAEREALTIFTHDKGTMSHYANLHTASGRNTFGVLVWTKALSGVNGAANDLTLIWAASQAEEWIDQTDYLPYRNLRNPVE